MVGELDLIVDRSRSGKHWIASEAANVKSKSDRVTVNVPTVTLDSLVAEGVYEPERVALLWIDAEHHEGEILEGAAELLRRGAPVVFEWDPAGLDRRGDRAKIQDLVGEHYTHFLDVRATHDRELPRYQLRTTAELVDYQHPSDGDEPGHFTEILVLRLTEEQAALFVGSIKPLLAAPVLVEPEQAPAQVTVPRPPLRTRLRRSRREFARARTRQRRTIAGATSKQADRATKRARASAKRGRRGMKYLHKRWKHTKPHVRRLLNVRFRATYRSTAARVPAREELPVLLNTRKLLGTAAVVGDRTGQFPARMLAKWRGERLLSIGLCTQEAKQRLVRFGERSEVSPLSPLDAAELIHDATLDFVYLDSLGLAKLDQILEAWFPKVKPGGFIAGYAYVDEDNARLATKSTVDSFFAVREIPVHCTDGPSAVEIYPSWIVEVPGVKESP